MKVAICGNPSIALQVQEFLKNNDIEINFFIKDFISVWEGGNVNVNLPLITFFEFRWLVNEGELDGVIIAEDGRSEFTKSVVQTYKLYDIPKVGIMDLIYIDPSMPIHWLDSEKTYLTQLETQIIDGCNLNCKDCCHFSNLFKTDEIYPIEAFRRDMHQLSQVCNVASFFLLGGEPLLMKNFDEYMEISYQYFPKSYLGILTNGLLIPSLSQKILDVMRETHFIVHISSYPPTMKILDKIKSVLKANKILCQFRGTAKNKKFRSFITLNGGNNPQKARSVCCNNNCRLLRNGKIYKCPIDALSYRLAEYFGIINYPKATGVNISAPNFSSLLPMLDGNVEMCHWCSEKIREIPWETSNKPKLEDWLADPEEIKNFL